MPSAIATGITIDSPPRPREQSTAKTFAVQSVDDTLQKIEEMDLPLLRRPWGGTEAVDPEGNVFTVMPCAIDE